MVLAEILVRDKGQLLYQGRLLGAPACKLVASLQLLFNQPLTVTKSGLELLNVQLLLLEERLSAHYTPIAATENV